MKEKLKKSLSEKRFRHCLGVAEEAARLAKIYGVDEEKAYTAGLIHDCAKGYTIDEQLRLCEKLNVELDDASRICPAVIHGFLGVEIAKREYGITDTEILNAIKYHTVGRAGMSILEKIIYISDMTEVNRNFPGVNKLREAVCRDLDETMIISIKQQLALYVKRLNTIHPNIILLWNDLILNKVKEKSNEQKAGNNKKGT